MKYVGVVAGASDDARLKQAALLCDRVICEWESDAVAEAVDSGLVVHNLKESVMKALHPDWNGLNLRFLLTARRKKLAADIADSVLSLENADRARQYHTAIADDTSRFDASVLSRQSSHDVFVPIVNTSNIHEAAHSTKATIAKIVIGQLPLPDASTSWQAIRDWRSDEEAREKYFRIRAWIAQAARSGIEAADIEEEFVAMVAAYERYVTLHHKKLSRTRFEAVLVPVAQLLEDIAHVRLSSAATRLCSLFKEEVTLLEQEMSAPGREVAYVAAARKQFQR